MLRLTRFWAGVAAGTGLLAFATAVGVVYTLTGRVPLPGFLGGGAIAPDEVLDVLAERVAEHLVPGKR